MRKISAIMIFAFFIISCEGSTSIKNQTRAGGYALGENVQLIFTISGKPVEQDSLAVSVFEKKTGYTYNMFAGRVDQESGERFEYSWNGRKPDGSWPEGGRYWVYAQIPETNTVSDTVEIGLTD